MFCTVKLDFWMNRNSTLKHTLLGTNISRQDGNSEDESSFPMVWFVSSLEGRFAPSAKRGLPQHGKSQAVWGWVGTIGMGGVAINKRQRGKNWSLSTNWEVFKFLVEVVLMEDILHQLIGSLSHHLQCFIHVGWCRISSQDFFHQQLSSLSLGKSYSCSCFSRSFFWWASGIHKK